MVIGEDCTYFDQRKACSICGARPAMRKTGKCAPHSVTPYDMNRSDDWIDCYEGCLKHDLEARSRWLERNRVRTDRPKKATTLVPSPVPSIDRLFLLHKHDPDVRYDRLVKIINEARGTRGIGIKKLGEAINRKEDYMRNRLTRTANEFSFMEVCDILAFFREFDNNIKMDTKNV